jgi:glycosyltransferase involved in cell wall biosynthesis
LESRHLSNAPHPAAASQPNPVKPATLSGKRAAVVLYSYYLSDPRPRRDAEAWAEAGASVDVFCLRESPSEPAQETVAGVQIFRIPIKRRRDSKWTYLWQYTAFLLTCALKLAWRSLRHRYHLVHVHNMPDVLVFSALVPRLLGAKVILDFHDPMPELYRSIYGMDEAHAMVRWLKRFEQWSIRFSHLSITPNLAFRDLFVRRGCPPDKMQIIMNSPHPRIFRPRDFSRLPAPKDQPRKTFRLMYHGSLVHRHGLDMAVESVSRLVQQIPGLSFDIFGAPTPYIDEVKAQIKSLKLEHAITYHGPKKLDDIARLIETIDLGIIPNRRSPFTDLNMPTRIFEYLAIGKPVIAPRTKGIQDYFKEDEILFFEPDTPGDLDQKILWAFQNPEPLAAITGRGIKIFHQHTWDEEEKRLLELTVGLLEQ